MNQIFTKTKANFLSNQTEACKGAYKYHGRITKSNLITSYDGHVRLLVTDYLEPGLQCSILSVEFQSHTLVSREHRYSPSIQKQNQLEHYPPSQTIG